MRIYIASSWENYYLSELVQALRASGYWVYDFRHPSEGENGFEWSDVDSKYKTWDAGKFVEKLNSSRPAKRQFLSNIEAMKSCDVCVLALPSGGTAHAEAGWFAGQGKKVYVYLPDDEFAPELVYKLFDKICLGLKDLVFSLFRDECLKEIEKLDLGADDDKEKQIRIKAVQDEFNKLLTEELIVMMRHQGHYSPKEIVDFIIEHFIQIID